MAARGYEFYLLVLKVVRDSGIVVVFLIFFLVGKVILRSEIGQGNSAVLV